MDETYDIAPQPRTPVLTGRAVVRDEVDEVIDAVAADLFMHAMGCVRAFGDFHLALSGGSTPEPLYRRLMYDPALRDFPWKRTHLWIVDERCVPLDHEKSNFRMIRELIVEQSDIPRDQVHPIDAMDPDGASRYEETLRSVLEWREKGHDRLDYALLGMGSDGHTASLFPHSPALDEADRFVVRNAGPTVTPPDRVTMTYTLLNATRFLAVMVTGAGKRPVIQRIEARQDGPRTLPILGISPLAGELRWYLDRAAAPA